MAEPNGYDQAKATADKLKAEAEAEKTAEVAEKALATVELKSLHSMAKVGMSHVDPADIRPPSVLLVQKLSDLNEMTDIEGKQPKVGQFFDTGNRKIMDSFDCFVVFAKKEMYTDRRKPEDGLKPRYIMVGAMKDSMKMFGMILRSSASYALNSLFTVANYQNYPMFVFNVHVEAKELKNDQGSWYIPVFRVGAIEEDSVFLTELVKIAKKFDAKADSVKVGDDNEDMPF